MWDWLGLQAVAKTTGSAAVGQRTSGTRRRSIQGKLTLLVLASVGVAVTLVTGVLAWRDGDRETHAALDRFASVAKLTAAMSEEAAATGDRQRAFEALRIHQAHATRYLARQRPGCCRTDAAAAVLGVDAAEHNVARRVRRG